jgi:hypothetical protein
LLAVKPAGQRNYEEVEGLYDRGHCQNRLAAILSDKNIIRLVRIFAPYGSFEVFRDIQWLNAYTHIVSSS